MATVVATTTAEIVCGDPAPGAASHHPPWRGPADAFPPGLAMPAPPLRPDRIPAPSGRLAARIAAGNRRFPAGPSGPPARSRSVYRHSGPIVVDSHPFPRGNGRFPLWGLHPNLRPWGTICLLVGSWQECCTASVGSGFRGVSSPERHRPDPQRSRPFPGRPSCANVYCLDTS